MKILLIFVLALILPLSVAASEPEDLKKIKDGQCPGCDLWGVNLEDADLSSANLRGANLKNSDLRNATLTNADLVGANLSDSDLRGTVFFGADLSNANLNNPSQLFCSTKTPFLTQVKLLGSYTLPYDIQLAGTFQSLPGQQVLAFVHFICNSSRVLTVFKNITMFVYLFSFFVSTAGVH